MKKSVFLAVLAAAAIVPLVALAFDWGLIALTPDQQAAVKASPDKPVAVQMNAKQLELIHVKFPKCTDNTIEVRAEHVINGTRIQVLCDDGKLHSITPVDTVPPPKKSPK